MMKKRKKSQACKTYLFVSVLLVMVLGMGIWTYGAPADSTPTLVEQADGTTITVIKQGDEYFNWTQDEEGYLVAFDPDSGNWRYAYVDGTTILPGRVNAGNLEMGNDRTAVDKVKASDYADQFAQITQTNREQFSTSPFRVQKAPSIKTDQKALVLLIEFNNVSIKSGVQHWYDTYFKETGTSVGRYYRDMSGGYNILDPADTGAILSGAQTTVSFTEPSVSWVTGGTGVTVTNTGCQGVVRVKLNMNHPMSRWNSSTGHNQVKGMISLAVKAIKTNNPTFDFSNVMVCGVVAGGEAACSSVANQVWAHKWNFNGAAAGLSGRRLNYMVTGEMYTAATPLAYGLVCHEMGHMLGLPDLYEGSGSGDVGQYSLMANGCYGYASGSGQFIGTTPVALDPWCKMDLGYITPLTVQAGTDWSGAINRVDTGNYNVLKVTSSMDPTQYFLIDNRAMVGYDGGLYRYLGSARKGGIMIYHVNENVRGNANANRRGVAVESADGSAISTSASDKNHFFSADLFHGRRLDVFSGTTAPNSHFNASYSPFTQNVTSNISLKVLDAPGAVMAVQVGNGSNPSADNAAIAAARTAIENASYVTAQQNAADLTQAKAAAAAMIHHLELNGVTAVVHDVAYMAAVAGTENDPDGTDGSYTFTVSLSKGIGTPVTTGSLTMSITAKKYSAAVFPLSVKAVKGDISLGYGTWMKGNLTTAFPPCTWTGNSTSAMPALYAGTMSITEPGTYYLILAGTARWSYDSTCKAIAVVVDQDGLITVQGYHMIMDSLGTANSNGRISYHPNTPSVLEISWGDIPEGNIAGTP